MLLLMVNDVVGVVVADADVVVGDVGVVVADAVVVDVVADGVVVERLKQPSVVTREWAAAASSGQTRQL